MNTFLRVFVLSAYVTLVLGVTAKEVTSPEFLSSIEKWWGPLGQEGKISEDIRPFKIQFTDEMVTDLRNRINNRREVTKPLEGIAFEYGFNSDNLDYWMDFWANKYNFTEREDFLNQFPHYKTNIQGLDIHFIRVKPEVPEGTLVLPLLMMHGWPGSIREFYGSIPLITEYNEKRGFAVEVIVPSLPGFGFSDGTTRPGMGEVEIAAIMKNLMARLGFEKFYVQGGDFGALIANDMVTFYPDKILGYHTNFPISLAPGSLLTYLAGSLNPLFQSLVVDSSVADRMYPILDVVLGLVEESGYLHMQATKPDTIGIALSDSPMGLFAWLMQSLSGGTRRAYKTRVDGGLSLLYAPETLIDDVMMYWTENKFTTAVRVYAESINKRTLGMGISSIPTSVPTCTIHAKDEIIYESPIMLKYKFTNLLRSTVLDSQGHFLAMEAPEVFSEDVLSALDLFLEFNEENNKVEESNSKFPIKLPTLPIVDSLEKGVDKIKGGLSQLFGR
ncbi:juvenile hormone epoxide hydrolase [Helicoverpa armigera]|uniref:juvenile hormone epoxide hydrolase n=1 Tax=Helicoverpa armigera TaxID=29058 RepID=UPI003082E44F